MNVSTEDLVTGLRHIARDLQSPDGTANRWILEAADRMTLLANLAARHVKEMESANALITRLEREVEMLRLYGNKDCIAQAEEALKEDKL